MIIPNVHNLNFKENGHNPQKIHCPKCHDERRNKQDKSLSVDIQKRIFKCHHCGWSGRIDGWKEDQNYDKPKRTGWSKLGEESALFLKARGFSLPIIEKNKIVQKWVGSDPNRKCFVGYPYFDYQGTEPVNMKWRSVEGKSFMQEKNAKPVMYNLNFWADGKEVIISEGENDVLAWNEVGEWNATTPNGGAINENDKNVDGKLAALHNCYRFFENKEVVYLATDSDGPGRRLKDELIKRIGAEKCRIISFPTDCKDANEVLQKYGKEKLLECKAAAKEVPVSGIFYLSDVMESMIDDFINGVGMGELTHFGDFDTIFRWKKGQINLWTGYANFGKSTFVLQVCLLKSIMDGWKWVVFSPENYPAKDFYNDIIEMYVGKNVDDQYSNKMSLEEYQEAADFINAHFFFIYPDDAHTIETLHELCRILLLKHGIDGLIVDPYNQVDNEEDNNSMFKEIQKFMSKVKRFCVENNISYNIIAHPKSPVLPKDGGEFRPADTYDIAGGSMWANKADNIISYHRPNWFTDKTDSTVTIHAQKIKRKRTGGKLDSITMKYDFMSARFYVDNGISRKYLCDPKRKNDYDSVKEIDTSFDFGGWENIETSNN